MEESPREFGDEFPALVRHKAIGAVLRGHAAGDEPLARMRREGRGVPLIPAECSQRWHKRSLYRKNVVPNSRYSPLNPPAGDFYYNILR